MRILLVGEYSNVHWTLAKGLRERGHDVVVASDGDGWKDYPRDINLRRRSLSLLDTAAYLLRLEHVLPRLRGFDIVQLINPVFLDLKAPRILRYYHMLRRHNGALVLGAYGIDHYWLLEGTRPDTFRYSDFYLYGRPRHNAFNDEMADNWLHGDKGALNQTIASEAQAIVSGLYEYHRCYLPHFPQKLHHIPFPIDTDCLTTRRPHPDDKRLRCFIGIQRSRHAYKGTDILLRALEDVRRRHPDKIDIVKAENVPYAQYQRMMDHCDVLLDQLYSYTPAMNGLLAMAKGLVLVGGGEEEHYQLLGEKTLRPIVNVEPRYDDVVRALEHLIQHPDEVRQRQRDSITYIQRHHDHLRVAQQYETLYKSIL